MADLEMNAVVKGGGDRVPMVQGKDADAKSSREDFIRCCLKEEQCLCCFPRRSVCCKFCFLPCFFLLSIFIGFLVSDSEKMSLVWCR